jgi:hypothetical protein
MVDKSTGRVTYAVANFAAFHGKSPDSPHQRTDDQI